MVASRLVATARRRAVEAVIAIERAFDVKFENEEVVEIRAPGEMYDLLLQKIPRMNETKNVRAQ